MKIDKKYHVQSVHYSYISLYFLIFGFVLGFPWIILIFDEFDEIP